MGEDWGFSSTLSLMLVGLKSTVESSRCIFQEVHLTYPNDCFPLEYNAAHAEQLIPAFCISPSFCRPKN